MKNKSLSKEQIKKLSLGFHLKGKIVDEKRGAVGIVYVIEQEVSEPRYVAYKTIETTDEKLGEEKLENFVREAKVWFKLKGHSLILTPFYITHFDDVPLICMPFCDKDLKSYMDDKEKFDLIETLVVISQITKALVFAKKKNINAHQDLKPANILLEDMSKKLVDFPPNCVHSSLRYKVRVADFGLSNAWKEIGKPQGSFPYMAPEQYTPKDYKFFSPDIFAIGVIAFEMLTGLHPCGKRTKRVWKDWNRRKWENWAKNGERKLELTVGMLTKNFEKFIKKTLLPYPEQRPSMEEALDITMHILSKIDKITAEQLKLQFEYYDTFAEHTENENRLKGLTQIAQIPAQLDFVINMLIQEISDLEKAIDTPRDVVYFTEIGFAVSNLLLKRRKLGDEEKVSYLAERIILEVIEWREKIKTHYQHPELRFKEEILLKQLPYRDFETYADLIDCGRILFEKTRGIEETERFFKSKDNYARSAYFYSKASELHRQGKAGQALVMLNKCIALNPHEAVFYYMKARWTQEAYIIELTLSKGLAKKKERDMIRIAFKNIEKAIQLQPDWDEAKEYYKKGTVRKTV